MRLQPLLFLLCSLTLCVGSVSSVLAKKTRYSKFVKSMDQNLIPSPIRKDKKKVYEGCGPIAGAMLLGY